MARSRKFDFNAITGDSLRKLSDMPTFEICKTGFEFNDLDNWLKDPINTHLDFVAIKSGVRPNDQQRIFFIVGYNSGGAPLSELMGDLPCPNNCVPPETIYTESGIDNQFEKKDIVDVLNFSGCTYLNVHSSWRYIGSSLEPTHSIYAITGASTAHVGPNDPIFTSTQGNKKLLK